jgi:hypothetical protein
VRGWFAGEGRIQACIACLEAEELELAGGLLPKRRELRRLPALLRSRDAVAARLVLADCGDARPALAAARALAEAGMLFEAAEVLLDLHEVTGDERSRADAARYLRRCPGASETTRGFELLSAGAESALQESAARLARRLDSIAGQGRRDSQGEGRTQPISPVSEPFGSSLWASTWHSDRQLRA